MYCKRLYVKFILLTYLACPNYAADVTFIVDVSNIVNDNQWTDIKNYINNIISQWDLRWDNQGRGVRVAVVTFGDGGSETLWDLTYGQYEGSNYKQYIRSEIIRRLQRFGNRRILADAIRRTRVNVSK